VTRPPDVSVVLPVLDERENLAPLLAEIERALEGRAYEVVAVDDGSTDGSLEELQRLRQRRGSLRVVALARHSGQSAALAAGWDNARGSVVVTLDADGQNDPADLPRLLDAFVRDPGLAMIAGVRTARRDPEWKKVQARVANTVRDWITGHHVADTGCGLKLARRATLLGLPRFDGMHRFLPTLVALSGGRVQETPVSHRPRRYGRSKYGAWRRAARGVRDALGVRWLTARRLRFDAREVTE
jgi:glycosyltransferase involved in cell wall biosynthesis